MWRITIHQLTAPSCLLFSVILELELESSSADILFGDSVSLFHVLILLLDVFSLQYKTKKTIERDKFVFNHL